MECLKPQQDVHCVELDCFLVKHPQNFKIIIEFTSGAVLDNQEQLRFRLKRVVKLDQKLAFDVLQYLPFQLGQLSLLTADDHFLIDDFDRVDLPVAFLACEENPAVRAVAEEFHEFKVLQADLTSLWPCRRGLRQSRSQCQGTPPA